MHTANKDIAQAAALVSFCGQRALGQIVAAFEDADSRGPKWRAALKAGIERMQIAYPALALPWASAVG